MSRWEVRSGWIESHNVVWLIGCSVSLWQLEASCTWVKNHATLLFPPQNPPKESLHNVICPCSCELQHISIVVMKSIEWGIREQENVLRQAWHGTLAVTVSSVHNFSTCFFMGNKTDTQQTSILVSWFAPAVLWQEPSEISAARRHASSLLTYFLTQFETVAFKWPHT